MRLALRLAARARGWTSPNPMVGALVVRDGRVVGRGYHRRAGGPHAEVHALEAAGAEAKGATLYVTVEPCCHAPKRTPPCTDAVIASGVRRVVVAMRDPNARVRGRGIRLLRGAGLAVEVRWTFAESPHRVGSMALTFQWPKLPPERRDAAKRAAALCAVHQTLHHPPTVTIELAP